MRLFYCRINPRSNFSWHALRGEEIIEGPTQRKLRSIDYCADYTNPDAVVDITVYRRPDGRLDISPTGLILGFDPPWESKPVIALPDPEFDLDEMAIGEELVKAGARLGKIPDPSKNEL